MKRFAVPFFGFNNNCNEKHFVGNAFIAYPNILITAGHNIKGEYGKNFSQFGIIFEHKEYILKEPVYIEYKTSVVNDKIEDLTIWDVSFINDNYLEKQYRLSNEDTPEPNRNHCMYAHDTFSAKGLKELIPFYSTIRKATNSVTIKEDVNVNINNCFELNSSPKAGTGYSGSPIVLDNLIYGMAIQSLANVTREGNIISSNTRCIKSSYISKIIENLK